MASSSNNIAEQRKKDAYEFALLLYDIFKEEQTNGNVDDDQNNNVYTDEE